MANYELVVNSKFQPFSFERYIQPYQIYGQAYREVENTLGELDTKASVWEEMANEQTDPYAYKMYKTYADDLEKQAGQLAREGLNASSRKDMLNMRARYSKEITPIEQAYAARQKQAEQQQQALLQDPTLMLSRRASTTSLDDYIRNPQLAYDTYSGKLLTAQVAQAASALAKEMRDKPRKWDSILNGQYFETMMKKGYTPEEVLAASLNDPNSPKELRDIVEKAVASSGIASWEDEKLLKRAYEFARQGLSSAIGETQYQTLQNQGYLNPLQRAQLKKLREEQNPIPKGGLALNPSNIYSSRELSKDEKKYKDILKNYSKYFYRDANGRPKMTWEGWKEYSTPVKSTSSKPVVTPEGVTILTEVKTTYHDSPFKRFMDSIGAKNIKGWQPGNLGNMWNRYINNNPAAKTANYDAMKATEYKYRVPASEEYQNNFKSKLSEAIGSSGELVEVDYDAKSNTWVPTGETLPFSKFDTKEYKLTSRAPSEIGTTWFIKKDGERAKRYRAVPGIHTTAEGGRDEALKQMIATQRMLQNPNLKSQQRAKLEKYYDDLAQQQMMFESQLDLTNQTSTQSFNPYYIP